MLELPLGHLDVQQRFHMVAADWTLGRLLAQLLHNFTNCHLRDHMLWEASTAFYLLSLLPASYTSIHQS